MFHRSVNLINTVLLRVDTLDEHHKITSCSTGYLHSRVLIKHFVVFYRVW